MLVGLARQKDYLDQDQKQKLGRLTETLTSIFIELLERHLKSIHKSNTLTSSSHRTLVCALYVYDYVLCVVPLDELSKINRQALETDAILGIAQSTPDLQ